MPQGLRTLLSAHTELVHQKPARVLLVEDNKINQQFATLVLTKAGYEVELAVNGRDGIDKYIAADFDIILMDIQMPVLDGISAIREIRTLPRPKGAVPIIAVSAHAFAGAQEEALSVGVDDYICKPFKPALLLERVGKVLYSASEAPLVSDNTGADDDPPGQEAPVLDTAQLEVLGAVFSPEKIKTLASLYLLDVEARLSLITQYRAASDFDGISRQAHMLVSTAGNLGAKETSALARVLEISCPARDAVLCDKQITALQAACKHSSKALKVWLEIRPGSGR